MVFLNRYLSLIFNEFINNRKYSIVPCDDPVANARAMEFNAVTIATRPPREVVAAVKKYCINDPLYIAAGLTNPSALARQFIIHGPNWLEFNPPPTEEEITATRAENRLPARVVNLEGRNAELAEDNAELRDHNTKLQEDNARFQEDATRSQEDVTRLRQDRNTYRNVAAEFESSLIESETKLTTLEEKSEAEKKTLELALAEVKAEKQRLLDEVKDDKKNLATLNGKFMEIQQTNTSIMSNTIDSNVDVVNTQVGLHNSLLKHAETNLSTFVNTFSNTNTSGIAQDNHDSNELGLDSEEVIKRIEVENSALKTDLEATKNALERKTVAVNGAEAEKTALKTVLEKTKAALEHKTKAVNGAEAEKTALKTVLEETKAALERKTETVNELNGDMTQQTATILGLKYEMTQSTKQKETKIEELKSLVASKTSQILALEFEKSLLVPTNPPKQTGIPDLTNEKGLPTLGTASTAADLDDDASNPRGTEPVNLGANTLVPSLQAAGTTPEHTGQHTGELVTTDKSLSNLVDDASNPRGTEPVNLGANTLVPSLQAAWTTPEYTGQHTGELVTTDKSLSNLVDDASNPRGTEPIVPVTTGNTTADPPVALPSKRAIIPVVFICLCLAAGGWWGELTEKMPFGLITMLKDFPQHADDVVKKVRNWIQAFF